MYETVSVEQILPYAFPALRVESPHHKHPFHRIVGVTTWRPGPNHIGMKNCDQEVDVLCVPGSGLSIHYFGNLFFDLFPWLHGCVCWDSTSSSNTPPALDGCTKTYLCPPAPILISSETRRTPSFFNRSTAADKSGTRRHTWCKPSPRLATNFAIVESSEVASSNSNRLSPSGTITSLTCSCSTVSSAETLRPSFW